MFTGIVEELGTVQSLERDGAILKLQILAPQIARNSQPGQSICVNGVCLTVVAKGKDLLSLDIVPETAKRSNLGLLQKRDKVNLERAVPANGRFDGHFVSGHIDQTGIISKKQRENGDLAIEIKTAKDILRYVVLKGSVALDGVSLTVSALTDLSFSVKIIPYTLANTTLGFKKEQDTVNIECDILGKYIDKFLSQKNSASASNITPSFLQEHGFLS